MALLKESCVGSKCEKSEQVTVPTAWALLTTVQSIQGENAKGGKESDSLSRMPLWTSGCNANNVYAAYIQPERGAPVCGSAFCFHLMRARSLTM